MKEEIHPNAEPVTVHCACGEEYETVSTKDEIRVEVCSNCHPFYTGKQRKASRGGRVERFNKKYGREEEEEEEE
ncbi:MAG: 50S ribosomal protein L31 [Bacillota bacterium]